jgi:superfamily I DNA/RNA helicase
MFRRTEDLALVPPAALRPFREAIHKSACALWQRMCDPTDAAPLGHDGYLKRWPLSGPVLDVDYVLLDEAQDSNAVMLGVLRDQQAQTEYVGDQHQQIYEWRGAVNAMQTITTPNTSYLTESFRFGPAIARAASRVLAALGETRQVQGTGTISSKVGINVPRAILCRTNAEVVVQCLGALDRGLLPHIVGGTVELDRMLRGVMSLKRGLSCDVLEFFGFKNWNEVVSFAATAEGEHLRSLVRIVDQHGEHALIAALSRTTTEEAKAGLVISTAHRAKGREWETVVLAEDFRIYGAKKKPEDPDVLDPSELRLLYVAMTRAKRAVQIPELIEEALGIPRTAE